MHVRKVLSGNIAGKDCKLGLDHDHMRRLLLQLDTPYILGLVAHNCQSPNDESRQTTCQNPMQERYEELVEGPEATIKISSTSSYLLNKHLLSLTHISNLIIFVT
jgi:hypothetical protein